MTPTATLVPNRKGRKYFNPPTIGQVYGAIHWKDDAYPNSLSRAHFPFPNPNLNTNRNPSS